MYFDIREKMEAADISIMGRHKHNALRAISRYRGVKNANPKSLHAEVSSQNKRQIWNYKNIENLLPKYFH